MAHLESGFDGETVKSTRSRAKHRNSRSGCLTCKQRKLKCDEEKPICRRCRGGARECKSDPRLMKTRCLTRDLESTTVPAPEQVLDSSAHATSCLQYFSSVTLSVFHRCEPSPLWSYLKQELPYSSSIRCMAIALGHEHWTTNKPTALNAPQASVFYIQAVQSLRQTIADLEVERPPNMMSTVVFHCLLLVILQCFRKSFDELNIHLQHGLQMASKAMRDHHTTATVPLKESFRLLKQYSIAVALFNPLLPQNGICNGSKIPTTNQALSNPDDLKATPSILAPTTHSQLLREEEQDLLLDLIGITITNRNPRMNETGDGDLQFAELSETNPSLQTTVLELRARHSKLERAIRQRAHSEDRERAKLFEVAEARCMLLGIYLRCRWSGYACNYDVEHDVFRRIVDKIQNSLDLAPFDKRRHPKSDASSAVSIGLGTVAPLFYVAAMCRHAEIRCRAVELLSKVPQQDGPWSSKLARDICRAFVAYEEQKAREEGCGFDLTGYIPEHCRIAYYYYYSREQAADATRRDYVRVFRRPAGATNVYVHEDLDLNTISATSGEL